MVVMFIIGIILLGICWYKAEKDGVKFKYFFWTVLASAMVTASLQGILHQKILDSYLEYRHEEIVVPNMRKDNDTIIFIK